MKALWWVLGIAFSIAGLVWIIALMGEVISRNTGFTAFSSQIWGFVVFHTVTMALGLFFFELAAKRKRTADSAQSR